MRLATASQAHKHTGLENEGFFGIGVKKDAEYRFSVWARLPEGGTESKIRVELIVPDTQGERQPFVAEEVVINTTEWKK